MQNTLYRRYHKSADKSTEVILKFYGKSIDTSEEGNTESGKLFVLPVPVDGKGEGMSGEYVVRNSAPTLAGIKTAALFSCPYGSKKEFLRELRALNCLLVPKGIRVIPVRYDEKRVLVYVYRPAMLREDLAQGEAMHILQKAGYTDSNQEKCIRRLICRLNARGEFPHEIGLFLGYPAEDVKGFMEHRGRDFKCCGLWKVYGDEERAKRLFAAYRRCTAFYCSAVLAGKTLEELADDWG